MESHAILGLARSIHLSAWLTVSHGSRQPDCAIARSRPSLPNRSLHIRLSGGGDAVPFRRIFHRQYLVGTSDRRRLYIFFAVLLFNPDNRSGPRDGVSAVAPAGAGEVRRRTAQCGADADAACAGTGLGGGYRPRLSANLPSCAPAVGGPPAPPACPA